MLEVDAVDAELVVDDTEAVVVDNEEDVDVDVPVD